MEMSGIEKAKRVILKKMKKYTQKEIKKLHEIEDLLKFDEAKWTATGAAVDSMNCDPVFLQNMDYDSNGRIMCYETKEAIKWLFKCLKKKQGILESSDILKLDDINIEVEEGEKILKAARTILHKLKLKNAEALTLDQVRQVKTKIESTPISEAGVVLPKAAKIPLIQEFFTQIVNTVGGTDHPTGEKGVNKQELDEFIVEAQSYLKWLKKGKLGKGQLKSNIMPLGEKTEEAYKAFAAIRSKIDQFFIQCKMLALNPHFVKISIEKEQAENIINFNNVQSVQVYLKNAALAKPNTSRVLYFDDNTNMYYEKEVDQFKQKVLKEFPDAKQNELTELQWQEIELTFKDYEQWQQSKQGTCVEVLGEKKLQQYLKQKNIRIAYDLIAESACTAIALDKIRFVEKLILFQKWILPFLNNFVYFPYLYDITKRAMFEMGTFIVDGRRFNLSIKVKDHEKHKQIVVQSNMFIFYAHILLADKEFYEVAIPVTSGGRGNLYIGKRGMFHDINGKDWDAIIVDIVENPISIIEAICRPFKNLAKMIKTKIEELKTTAETNLGTMLKQGAAAPQTAATQTPAATGTKGMGNIFMGGGIAIAALGSSLAFITKTLSELQLHTILISIAGALLAVLLPTFIIALNKLGKRDLSTILEASGWAINMKMRLTFRLSRFFTQRPLFQQKSKRWKLFLILFILLLISGVIITFIVLWQIGVIKLNEIFAQ